MIMRFINLLFLCLLAFFSNVSYSSECFPSGRLDKDAVFSSSKKIFAHYFYPFPLRFGTSPAGSDYYSKNYLRPEGERGKFAEVGGFLRSRPLSRANLVSASYRIDDLAAEVRAALAIGIGGFSFNVMSKNNLLEKSSRMHSLIAAISLVDHRFKLLLMPDMTALKGGADELKEIIKLAYRETVFFRTIEGGLVVAPFAAHLQKIEFWQGLINDLYSDGYKIELLPVFFDWKKYISAYKDLVIGYSDWGEVTPSWARKNAHDSSYAHAVSKIYMAPIGPQQYRPKNSIAWEPEGADSYIDLWHGAINSKSDLVQLVTWNDFSESSQVAPYTDLSLDDGVGVGFYYITSYFSDWYLSESRPKIMEDMVFVFYRRHFFDDGVPKKLGGAVVKGKVSDFYNLLVFSKSGGDLIVKTDRLTRSFLVSPGLNRIFVPLSEGRLKFYLNNNQGASFSNITSIDVSRVNPGGSEVMDLTYWAEGFVENGRCSVSLSDDSAY